jgi:hypothetical protein
VGGREVKVEAAEWSGMKMYLTVEGMKYECRGPMSTTKAIVRHLLNSPLLYCRFASP